MRQPAPRRPAAAACPRGGRPPLSRALLPLFQQGKILEKMGVCSKLAFTRYVRSGRKLGPDPRLWLGDARFGRVPVRVYRPRAPSAGPRAGAIFLHGGGWRYCGIGRTGRVVPALTAQLCAAAVIFWRRGGGERGIILPRNLTESLKCGRAFLSPSGSSRRGAALRGGGRAEGKRETGR